MYANSNYENDVKYTFELNRFIFRLLGIWPYMEGKPSFLENLKNFTLILGCCFLLCIELIPNILYLIYVETPIDVKVKVLSPASFTALSFIKYICLVFSRNQIKSCLIRIQKDWRNFITIGARHSMIERAKTARYIFVLSSIFMYSGGLYFRTVVPFSKGKSVNEQNITIRHLATPGYYFLFNGQISPAYEIMFFVQFFSGFVKYTITVAICSLVALFILHICAQLEILITLINDMVNDNDNDNENGNMKQLAAIVECQIKMRNFLQLVQSTLEFTSLLEVLTCTLCICILGYQVLLDWKNRTIISMFSYLILLISFGFNIFILCFIGEQLSTEGEKLALTVCTLDWYRLSNLKAKALILIIAMSNIPTKFRAGKFFDLSIKTFGDVVKTALAYFNIMRNVIDY